MTKGVAQWTRKNWTLSIIFAGSLRLSSVSSLNKRLSVMSNVFGVTMLDIHAIQVGQRV